MVKMLGSFLKQGVSLCFNMILNTRALSYCKEPNMPCEQTSCTKLPESWVVYKPEKQRILARNYFHDLLNYWMFVSFRSKSKSIKLKFIWYIHVLCMYVKSIHWIYRKSQISFLTMKQWVTGWLMVDLIFDSDRHHDQSFWDSTSKQPILMFYTTMSAGFWNHWINRLLLWRFSLSSCLMSGTGPW